MQLFYSSNGTTLTTFNHEDKNTTRWGAGANRNDMNIYAKKGDLVIVTEATKNNGYPHDKNRVAELLSLNEPYKVVKTDVGDCATRVYLDGFVLSFNSVNFEDYKPIEVERENTLVTCTILDRLEKDAATANPTTPSSNKAVESVEEAAEWYEKIRTGLVNERPLYNGFIVGASWQKQQDNDEVEPLIRTLQNIASSMHDTGREGCTYNDTEYDSLTVVYGYNLAVDAFKQIASTALSTINKK